RGDHPPAVARQLVMEVRREFPTRLADRVVSRLTVAAQHRVLTGFLRAGPGYDTGESTPHHGARVRASGARRRTAEMGTEHRAGGGRRRPGGDAATQAERHGGPSPC